MSTAQTGDTTSLKRGLERLSPRQRQWAMLVAILLGGVGMLWLVFAFSDSGEKYKNIKSPALAASAVTHIGVMSPGQQVNPLDQWVGTAGRKLAQYESERDEQGRLNKERQAFEARTMQRFSELEQRLTAAAQPAASAVSPVPPAPPAPPAPATSLPMAPPLSLPAPAAARPMPTLVMPPGSPGAPMAAPPPPAPAAPVLTRVTLVDRSTAPAAPGGSTASSSHVEPRSVSTFLPVSFTRGTLLGGLDAPTGGRRSRTRTRC